MDKSKPEVRPNDTRNKVSDYIFLVTRMLCRGG